jgi:hypothetical protein
MRSVFHKDTNSYVNLDQKTDCLCIEIWRNVQGIRSIRQASGWREEQSFDFILDV